MRIITEKKHRLDADLYKGFVIAAFTACTKGRVEAFWSKHIFKKCEESLLGAVRDSHCDAVVYLFMPDHCHIILQGKSEQASVLDAMKKFKQRSGYWFSTDVPEVKWQKGFYDHLLRREEELEKHVRYVLENPLRKGLVNDWRQYEFKGSSVYNLGEW